MQRLFNSESSQSYAQFNYPPNNHLDLPSVFTKNFGVKAVMKTSVLLTWDVPETYKSQVPLKVRSAHTDSSCRAESHNTATEFKATIERGFSFNNVGPTNQCL